MKVEPMLMIAIIGLLGGCVASAVGLGYFVASKLAELKEYFHRELRDTRHTLYGRIDQQGSILSDKMDDHEQRASKRMDGHEERIRAVEIASRAQRH